MRLTQDSVGIGKRVERHVGGPFAAQTVARHIQGDGVQPWLQPQVGALFGRHFAECAVRANERILNDLLGIFPVSRHAQREAVEATLIVVYDPFEVRYAGAGIGPVMRRAPPGRRRWWHVYSREEWCERAHIVPPTTTARAEVSRSTLKTPDVPLAGGFARAF